MTYVFTHETLGQRVRFAPQDAAAGVAAELDLLGARRVLLIASERESSAAAQVAAQSPVVHTHTDVVMHVPVATAERARAVAAEHDVDAILTVGGGSATGLGKAIALTSGAPLVAVPTTYAGSEATDVWGLTKDGAKTTGSDPRVLPRAVVYDAALTTSLPIGLSVASGLNALAHCVDAVWAPRADPLNAALAEEGIRALNEALPVVVADGDDLEGRSAALYGAYVSAVAFASAGSGLHHKICHVLGGRFDLPHAPTHAIVLPHVLALNGPAAPAAAERIARGFGAGTTAADADAGLAALRRDLDAPRALRELGLREQDLSAAVAAILPVVPASNPTTVTEDNLGALLRRAWEGADPR